MQKIMFNDCYGLTQAVLEGRKTMTRRLICKNIINYADTSCFLTFDKKPLREEDKKYKCYETIYGDWVDIRNFAQYKVGEEVAIAQSYNEVYEELKRTHGSSSSITRDFFHKYIQGGRMPVSNKMFVKSDEMIKHIKITDIKVERLQDISDDDCIKEGVVSIGSLEGPLYVPSKNLPDVFPTARSAFSFLIDKVSGKGTFERNPWVFAYSFKLIK